jgi:hypothetical protein
VEINASLKINISEAMVPPAQRYVLKIFRKIALAIPQVLSTVAGFGQAAEQVLSTVLATCKEEDLRWVDPAACSCRTNALARGVPLPQGRRARRTVRRSARAAMPDFTCLTANVRPTNALAQVEQLQLVQPVLKTKEQFAHPAKLASTWSTPNVRLINALARTETPLQVQNVQRTMEPFAEVVIKAFI